MLTGLDQGGWFHEFVCLSLDKRNRMRLDTTEESEAVGRYQDNLANAVARVFKFSVGPKMSR